MNKILLNGLHYTRNGAGISKYTYRLLKQFSEKRYNLDILIRKELKDELISNNYMYSNKCIFGSTDRIIYEQLLANKLYKNYDLIHFPDYATPVLFKGKKIATIHDMAMHTMKDKYTRRQILTKNILLNNTINHADRLICDSEFSKKELIRYYPEVEEKVEVVYCGIDIPDIIIETKEEEEILNRFKIEKKNYILYVGTIAPQKNIENLIRAFDIAKKDGLKCKIVIAGKKGWDYEGIFKYIVENNLKRHVVFTDYISNMELEILYKNALLFTSVSLYEGFGFPPLEAMGRNVPILVSDIEIFRETCRDGAAYCNPNNIQDIADSIISIVNDSELRNVLKANGKSRVKEFNWSKTAKLVYDIYLDVLK